MLGRAGVVGIGIVVAVVAAIEGQVFWIRVLSKWSCGLYRLFGRIGRGLGWIMVVAALMTVVFVIEWCKRTSERAVRNCVRGYGPALPSEIRQRRDEPSRRVLERILEAGAHPRPGSKQ